MKKRKISERWPLWLVIVSDVLLVGVILLTYAFFHHAYPSWLAARETERYLAQQELNKAEPEKVAAPVVENEDDSGLTSWQKKFAEHFSDEVVITDNSYVSPQVSVTIETVVETINKNQVTYYVADIYVASLDNFKTYTAYDQMRPYVAQKATDMAQESKAIFAISGDYFSNHKDGFIVRNGETYCDNRNSSICVLYSDGTMETHARGTYKIEDIEARDPVQVWSFGPSLLDGNGNVYEKYNVTEAIKNANPRSAIGYFEPGHYMLVVVDGRQRHSYGVTIPQLAQIFADRGCKVAYNLDGGGSAVALYGGENFSKPCDNRQIADIVIITEDGYEPHKKEKK